MYEIINAIEDSCEDKLDAVYMLRELANTTIDIDFYMKLEDRIRNICVKNQLCPACFIELEVRDYEDHRGNQGGYSSYEKMHELACPKCG